MVCLSKHALITHGAVLTQLHSKGVCVCVCVCVRGVRCEGKSKVEVAITCTCIVIFATINIKEWFHVFFPPVHMYICTCL